MKLGIRRLLLTAGASALFFGAAAGCFSRDVHADTNVLSVKAEQIFLLPVPIHHAFEVVFVATVNNPSSSNQNVVFSLPAGYQALSVEGVDPKSVQIENGQFQLRGFAKARHTQNITYRYTMSLDGQQGVQFTLHSFYPVYAAHAFLPVGNAALSAEGLLTTTQTVTVSGTQFREFSRLGIPAGDDWTMSLQMLPSVTPDQRIQGFPIIGRQNTDVGNTWSAILNLLLAAFVLVVGLSSIRSTQGRLGTRRTKKHLNSDEALSSALESLDLQHQSGLIEQAIYEKRRIEVKRKLVELRLAKARAEVAHVIGSPKE